MVGTSDSVKLSQQLSQQLVEMTEAVGLVLLDRDGQIASWNLGAERITGFSSDQIIGKTFAQLLTASEDSQDFTACDLVLAEQGVHEGYHQLRHQLGKSINVRIRTSLLKGDDEGSGFGLVLTDLSELQHTQNILQDRNDLLAEMEEISGLGSYEVDATTWTGRCSPALCRIYGFENDEPFRDFNSFCQRHVHPDDLQEITVRREESLRVGGTSEFEYRYQHPDGRERILLVRRRFVVNSEGRAIRMTGTVQDITQRKQAEARLRTSETRYRTLLDHATDAYFLHAAGGAIVDMNQRACDNLGYTREELIGQYPALFADQLTSDRMALISSELEAGHSLSYDSYHRRKDGSTFPVEVRIRPFRLDDQRFSITLIRDLSQDRLNEQALRESEERYRLALETVQLGTWHYEKATGRFVLDARCQNHWGISEPEIELAQLFSRVHPADRERIQYGYQRAARVEEQVSQVVQELRMIMPGGQVRWVSLRASLRFDGSGTDRQLVSAAGTTLDITKPRTAAVALKGQNRVFERIATGEPLNEVLAEITRLIEEQIPETLCSILLLDRDGQSLRVGAGNPVLEDYNAAVDGVRIGPDIGSCGTAAWSRQTVITDDIQTDPRWAGFRSIADKAGLRSCWSIPIFAATHGTGQSLDRPLVGTFAVYRRYPGSPDAGGQMALISAAHLAGVAVGSARAVQEIRDSEARYAIISQITRSVTFGLSRSKGQDWTLDWARPRFGLLSGYSHDEIAAVGWKVLFHPDDRKRVDRLLNDLSTGQAVREEVRYITKNGAVLDVQIHASRLEYNPTSGTETVIGGVLDISELKAIEKALRKSEERFHLAMLGANDGLWDWNLKTDEVFYSPQWLAILGFGPGQLTENVSAWSSLLHPDDAQQTQNQIQAFLRSGLDKYEIEFRLRHKDGSYRNIQSRGFVSRENGVPVRLVGTHRDLTDRKLAEQALRRSEEFLRRAQLMAHVGSWSLDLRTQIFDCSEESARIYGLAGRDCTLVAWKSMVHPDDFVRVDQAFNAMLEGVPFEQDYRLVVRGKTKWVSVKANVEADATSHASHVIGVTQDVSARRRLEEQLRHSQKMEAFGQLAGGVAHDFNNLLTVINGFSEMLLSETKVQDPRFHSIEQIREAGERAAVLTRQLLTLSRRQFTEPRVIGLNEIVSRAESMLRRVIGENILVETLLEADLPNIKADPGQIDQVLLNLVVNARDAMPDGGRITISTRRRSILPEGRDSMTEPLAGHYVELSVSDNGTGMTEETKARIYEPFFSTKGVGKGTGLGLATVYGIVQQNQGFIGVESFPSQGTTFRILLPVTAAEPQPNAHAAAARQAVRGTETVLLAEDEPLVRQLAVISLKTLGYTVMEADSGESAMRMVGDYAGPLDLLITDVVMPNISGTELARQLRLIHPDLRVLYMSGYTDDAIVRSGAFTSHDDFIQKPFTPVQLARKVQDLLHSRSVNPAVS